MSREFAFPRLLIFISIIFDFIFNIFWRFILKKFKPKDFFIKHILFVGNYSKCLSIYENIILESPYEFNFIGIITSKSEKKKDNKLKFISSYNEIDSFFNNFNGLIDTIIFDNEIEENREKLIFKLKNYSDIYDFDIRLIPNIYEFSIGKLDLEQIAGVPFIKLNRDNIPIFFTFCKYLFDKIFSLIFIILFLPFYIIIAILIKLDSKGPIFYLQKRVGKNYKEFNIIKFRTMKQDAEKQSGPVFAKENDDRITKLGLFLRKTRLDETTQFFNVIKGDMSIIGPRPERMVFVKKFEKEILGYSNRMKIKPGITGLAQIYGKYDTDAKDKLKYDMIYFNNLGFLLEIQILFTTIRVIFTGHGAK
jgi:exopolysaccharide biosynthesis polyprenyl glycosylphosphotransferase